MFSSEFCEISKSPFLTEHLQTTAPESYRQFTIIADNYTNSSSSTKCEKLLMRGESEPIQISSVQSKVLESFRYRILRYGNNKERLVELFFFFLSELLFDYVKQQNDVLVLLLSTLNIFHKFPRVSIIDFEQVNVSWVWSILIALSVRTSGFAGCPLLNLLLIFKIPFHNNTY